MYDWDILDVSDAVMERWLKYEEEKEKKRIWAKRILEQLCETFGADEYWHKGDKLEFWHSRRFRIFCDFGTIYEKQLKYEKIEHVAHDKEAVLEIWDAETGFSHKDLFEQEIFNIVEGYVKSDTELGERVYDLVEAGKKEDAIKLLDSKTGLDEHMLEIAKHLKAWAKE